MKDSNAELVRLREAREQSIPWRKWGPYLSDRQWGTVREDYSRNGDAWNAFSHDQARSRAYHWGEDGIAGVSDEEMRLCFALALWNGRDPILKERLFGLTNGEGNHGEDVKEYYYYLDSTPTHSYMRMLYKYPHGAFPYDTLVRGNGTRGRLDPEFELIETGIFDDDAYFDVSVEYAKASPEHLLIRITAINRGHEPADLHLLPHLWFRNTWWRKSDALRPSVERAGSGSVPTIVAKHDELGTRRLYCEGARELLFTDNDTNELKLFGRPNRGPYVKDGIAERVVHGKQDAVNPAGSGTKSAAWYQFHLEPGESRVIRLVLKDDGAPEPDPFGRFDSVFEARAHEADDFYGDLTPATVDADRAAVMRQGFAGMMWSKQTYIYDLHNWLEDRADANGEPPDSVRNRDWAHMASSDVISMPDKWEYPWFAAWDLAFHAVTLSVVDPDFALHQLNLLLRERFVHPNGQIAAYEWNFSDVNPPVHAWALLFIHRVHRQRAGALSHELLRAAFHRLLFNFAWWVNRKDREGRNVFEGGFLGLDNIAVFDRSSPLPTGGWLEQSDGTAWMALYCQTMLEIAIELAVVDPAYEDMAVKFYEHFVWIAAAMNRSEDEGMWDEEDGFFYDVLRLPNGHGQRLKVRSLVGLLPLCAVTVYTEESLLKLPRFVERERFFNKSRPDLFENVHPPGLTGIAGRHMLSLLDDRKLRRVLARLLDPEEFLSDYGIRSLSRVHLEHPYVFRAGGAEYKVAYCPAESDSGLFGGNSNWRGPIWMPVNALLIRALLQLYRFYGDDFKVECPTGSGNQMTLFEVSREIQRRLVSIFTRDENGRRAVHGGVETFQHDPHWRDLLLFYEYFHGDNGAGIGASHQTGWTGLVSALIGIYGQLDEHEARDGVDARLEQFTAVSAR
jgi:mannosylglycerate hydrolase MGH1-like protein